MKEIFYISPHNTHRRHDISVQSGKQIKVIKALGLWIHIYGTHCQKNLNLRPQSIFKDLVWT